LAGGDGSPRRSEDMRLKVTRTSSLVSPLMSVRLSSKPPPVSGRPVLGMTRQLPSACP
jgi:hypothetical protein